MIPPPPRSTLFPYTTLFRSTAAIRRSGAAAAAVTVVVVPGGSPRRSPAGTVRRPRRRLDRGTGGGLLQPLTVRGARRGRGAGPDPLAVTGLSSPSHDPLSNRR